MVHSFTDILTEGYCFVISMFSECFFILRTYVLWNKNEILLAAMLSTSLSFLVASFIIVLGIGIRIPAAYMTSPIPGITGCY
ncbi:hypothetical protein EV424DRAFT_1448344 [Suillus variegatus]|nr:hypothetical protein EV424DRAFT_1448344 [Suillus variegatus]